jgi:hypothetical protein
MQQVAELYTKAIVQGGEKLHFTPLVEKLQSYLFSRKLPTLALDS